VRILQNLTGLSAEAIGEIQMEYTTSI